MFGGAIKVSGKLHEKLNNQNLTVQELFEVPNIIGDIKQNIQLFLTFCLKRKQFTTQMIQICLDSSYQTLQEEINKIIAYNTLELLSCDEDALGKFLFNSQETLKTSSEISQQVTENIVNDAERLFGDDQQNNKAQWKKDPDVFEKYQLIKITLNILKNPQKNQSCLGYINKIYSSLLRRQPSQFLEFLSLNKQYMDLMLKATEYHAIGSLLMVILSAQDKSGQYKYQSFKKQVFQEILKIALASIEKRQKFEGIVMMVEEILNTTKQSYYEYFDDFKRCANILVSEQTLRKFFIFVQQSQGNSFITALSYLQLIVRRINVENDESENDYYKQNDSSTSSLKFEHSFLFSEVDTFIKIGLKIIQSQKESFKKMVFFSFLLELFKNRNRKQANLDNLQLFKNFMKMLVLEKSHGMIKNYLYQLVNIIIVKVEPQKLQEIVNWFFFNSDEEIKQQIKQTNPLDNNLKNVNQNENNCYIQKVIFTLKEKCPQFVELQQSQMAKVSAITNRYSIKLAKEEEKQKNYLIDEDFKLEFPMDVLKKKKVEETTIGKNNISIPSLNIPNINEHKVVIEQEQVKQVEIPEVMSREAMIQNLKNTKKQLDLKFKKNQQQKTFVQNKQNYPVKIQQSGLQFFARHLILF